MGTDELKKEIVGLIEDCFDDYRSKLIISDSVDVIMEDLMKILNSSNNKELDNMVERFRKVKSISTKYKMGGVKLELFLWLRDNELITCIEHIETVGDRSFTFDCGALENGNFLINCEEIYKLKDKGIVVDLSNLNFKMQIEIKTAWSVDEIIRIIDDSNIHSGFIRINDKGFKEMVNAIYAKYVVGYGKRLKENGFEVNTRISYGEILRFIWNIIDLKEERYNNGRLFSKTNELCSNIKYTDDYDYIGVGMNNLIDMLNTIGKVLKSDVNDKEYTQLIEDSTVKIKSINDLIGTGVWNINKR
jgi:hypothetical protein